MHRVTNRLGWVKTKTPAETERELRRRVAEKDWPTINKVFVPFGRAICIPGSPRCSLCPLVDVCQFKKKNLDAPRNVEAITAAIARQEAALARLKANAVQ
ncbi:hypothetical protein HYS28_02660 [Candidatus Uhrbacteria bacterium]|nr:hypothetical protein [Candidatus Uhrbacteria bacterium]